jgi:spore coat protein U-like protein
MKKLILFLFIMAVSLYSAGAAYAGTATSSLDVNVNAVDACTLVSTGAVNFPDYDGSSDVNATGDVTVNCSTGVFYEIAFDAGLNYDPTDGFRKLTDGSGNFLSYYLTDPLGSFDVGDDSASCGSSTFIGGIPLSSVGDSTNQSNIVNGRIFSSQTVPTGPYSDTVGVTVCW